MLNEAEEIQDVLVQWTSEDVLNIYQRNDSIYTNLSSYRQFPYHFAYFKYLQNCSIDRPEGNGQFYDD